MEKLYIVETENTPKVYLCEEENLFQLIGESRPEDAISFYTPVINWFENFCSNKYKSNTKSELTIEINLDYYNPSSARLLLQLFSSLENFSTHEMPINIKWHHADYDEDILEKGRNFAELHAKLNFEFICNATA